MSAHDFRAAWRRRRPEDRPLDARNGPMNTSPVA
jgi:hypothetical protein